MKTFKFITSVLSGALLSISAGAYPASPSVSQPEVSFHAFPINSRSLLEMGQEISEVFGSSSPYLAIKNGSGDLKNQWPNQAIQEKPVICQSFGVGCFLIDYFDLEALKFYPKFESSPESEKELPTNHGIYSSTVAQRVAETLKQVNLTKIPKKISENILLSQAQIVKRATGAIQKANHDLNTLGKLSSKTKREILNNPFCFKDLPRLYSDYLQSESAEKSLKEVMSKALWLTLESLTNSAYSRLPGFPYRNDDSINLNNFLTADFGYDTLSKLERTAPIISLTPDLRQALAQRPAKAECGGKASPRGFNSKTSSGGWFTIAAYVPNLNSFLIDFTQDFYETVYAFEHELWHAVTENTVEAQNYRTRVEELARLPVSDNVDLALKQTIFWSVIQDELHAIHESNLLYRFAGQLTNQWGGHSPSAKGWHDSEFITPSFDADHFYNSISLREYGYYLDHPKPSAGERFMDIAMGSGKGLTGIPIADFFVSLGAETLMMTAVPAFIADSQDTRYKKRIQQELTDWNTKINSDTRALDEFRSKTQSQFPPEVIELFGDRYRLTLPDFKTFERSDQISDMKFERPEPVKLSCSEAQHISSLMPCEWDGGMPFYFVVTDPTCPIQGGTQPENTGSHPSLSSLMSISALPCLNGAENAAQ